MKARYKTAMIGGEERRLVFTTQAFGEVIERYGSMQELYRFLGLLDDKEIQKKLKKNRSPKEDIKDYAWIIALLINQGIEIDNFENGKDTTLLSEKAVVLYMAPYEFGEVKNAAIEAIFAGMLAKKAQEEAQDGDEVLAEIKNAEGAATTKP